MCFQRGSHPDFFKVSKRYLKESIVVSDLATIDSFSLELSTLDQIRRSMGRYDALRMTVTATHYLGQGLIFSLILFTFAKNNHEQNSVVRTPLVKQNSPRWILVANLVSLVETNYHRLFVTVVCRLDWNHGRRWGTGFFRYSQELVVQ